jgi:ABC-type glycerol-3-phosphate transport system permease component
VRKGFVGKLSRRIALLAILIFISILFVSPFIWVLLTSFKSTNEIYTLPLSIFPEKLVLTHYIETIGRMGYFPRYFLNSTIVCAISIVLTLLISSSAGFALARIRFRGKMLMLVFLILVMGLPWGVYLIPIYLVENLLGILNTWLALILPYTALNLPMAIYLCRGGFKVIPSEIENAALIDGCNPFQMWTRVMMPIIKPSLTAATIMTFVIVWGEFMFAQTLASHPSKATIPIGIVLLQTEEQAWAFGTLCTVIIISILPVLIVFVFLQRFIIKGFMEGALKG